MNYCTATYTHLYSVMTGTAKYHTSSTILHMDCPVSYLFIYLQLTLHNVHRTVNVLTATEDKHIRTRPGLMLLSNRVTSVLTHLHWSKVIHSNRRVLY